MIESVQDGAALSGRVALVTGAARGIGEAITRLLAARGAAVVLADRDGDLARSVADDLAARVPRALPAGRSRPWAPGRGPVRIWLVTVTA